MNIGFDVIKYLPRIREQAVIGIPTSDVALFAKENGFVRGAIIADHINGRWTFGYYETTDVNEAIRECKKRCEMFANFGIESHSQHFIYVSTEYMQAKFWLAGMVRTF